MKIGLITGEFPPMEGGVGAFTQELARALNTAGHEIHVITSRNARPTSAEGNLRVRDQPIDLGYAQLHARIKRWRWPSVATVADIILRQELEIVDIQYQAAAYNMKSPAINLLPWRLHGVAKNVVTFHDLRVPYLFPKAGRWRETAVRFMARQSHGVIVTNAEDYRKLTPLIKTPLAQIPIGSNIKVYRPNHIEIAEVRDQLGLTTDDHLLGYFGFLNESKGADTLLRALANLDDHFHLVFIGGQTGASDPTNVLFLQKIKDFVSELNLSTRVHWTGFLSDTRVSTFLHAAEMLVMPYRDGASLRRGTLMAALAHGRPLITTTPSEATPELVHKNNVWLLPERSEHAQMRGDVYELVDAIRTLADQPKLRQTLGEGAANTANMFAWEAIAARSIEFFAALMKGSRH